MDRNSYVTGDMPPPVKKGGVGKQPPLPRRKPQPPEKPAPKADDHKA